ncbi:N,N-dimethylformamidase beta subunit family domain-containing protein [Adhaeribacter soli]|uniref:N,N-dimethylformamidase beta subunit family domain-containing protein n=1 Tax=Adhaeribacter soli TaxID=2607655 RepID=UPI001CD9C6E7|nr:N,N-dimethylformamidase beta subunit family domain-containing protein [Adhaeribacter soli]
MLLCFFFFAASAQNSIATENALPGNPASEWDISGAGDLSIQGFATDISYNKGETARFKIKTNASAYTIRIYRLGYYQGNGARFMGNATVTATLPQTQPTCLTNSTGLIDCGNWAESASWNIPANAVSGIYIAKLTRTNTGGSSHITFVVRDDASTSDLLFQTSDATWQAYNVYGDNNNGKSLYTGSGGKASKVSYNRPFYTRSGGGGGGSEDWLFNAEYPMIRFLERNGYNVTYTTNVDTDRRGNLIQNHKAFLSVGHDEYWSKGMRDNVEAARNAGRHLAFFSGNEVYWKTRWENSIDGSGKTHRTLVCYKEGTLGENQCNTKCDPSSEWTGLWRSGCEYPASDGCRPENELSGQISWEDSNGALQVPATFQNLRFWRNTSVAGLGTNQTATFTPNTVGYEWNSDQEVYRSSYPAGRVLLSRTVIGGKTHNASLYKHNSGALVFGAGTVQWSWGLDGNHDRGSDAPSRDMQQATLNLLADMAAQPGSKQADLTAATASADNLAPTVAVTSPTNGANVPSGAAVTISGTASDANTVAGIEVSVDGGTTWRQASGTTNWTFSWIPSATGPATIRCRAFDDSGNLSGVVAVNVTVGSTGNPNCPCTVFLPTDNPGASLENDNNQPIQLGMKFTSTTNGFITGVRFYKNSGNTGTHTGQLYSSTGTLLAQATFTNETASGWQEQAFANPVAINANTTYIISYHSSAGFYSVNDIGFATALVNGPLKGLANGENGPNGVYQYSATPTFPTTNFQASNYYVDVVFNTIVGPDTNPPVVLATIPVSNAIGVNEAANISITFNEALDPSTVSSATISLMSGSSPVPATVTFDALNRTVTLDPLSNLNFNANYSVIVRGGTADPRIKDVAGNALAADYTFAFTTRPTPPPPPPSANDGPGGPILVISSSANPFSRYPVEILRAEGFNEFAAKDISEITANTALLNSYDVILLGEISLSAANVTSLTNWVEAGGTLIAFKPDPQLASLLGLSAATGTLSDRYLLVNTTSGPGVGIVNQTIQYHGAANLYALNGAASLATLYSNATTATTNPAVTMRNVGSNGGKAVAFAYDLARSIVYTRQGNPAWAGQKRDGQSGPIRSDDMFFPDWIDFNKVAIPQADEQQRLLANIIIQANLHKKPLPRFWYLPRGLKAAVVMTGDDHAGGGTVGRFNDYVAKSASNTPQAVAEWTAIRGTSYIYPGTNITNAQAMSYEAQGFEISLHLNTNCATWTPTSVRTMFDDQLASLAAQLPGISTPVTHRTHCISWSDWATKAKAEAERGIRLDANYYYWPGAWINDRPGMFTGSGIPMRFADLDGTLIDCYQAATQLTDESNITYSTHINSLLDNALGANGYYGVFTANMHTDVNGGNSSNGSNIIVAAAQQRQVPVISAKQMLTWLDGRNNSSFGAMSWNNGVLNFTVTAADGSHNLRGMLPIDGNGGQLTGITVNGEPVSYTTETIKGMAYAFFPANSGNYAATYSNSTTPLQISAVNVSQTAPGSATVTWNTNVLADSKVAYGTAANQLNLNVADANPVTAHSLTLTGLTPATTYYYRVTSATSSGNNLTEPDAAAAPLSFTTPAAACFSDETVASFNAGTIGTSTFVSPNGVTLKPQLAEEFTTLPATSQWQSFPWTSGGTSTITNGQVVVDGARYNTEPVNAAFGPGTTIEFVGTFGNAPFQHIGFGSGDDAAMFNTVSTWAMFSTGSSGSGLLARVANNGPSVDIPVGSNLLGSPHRYKISWKANAIEFYVDCALVHTQNSTLTAPMRVGMSDFTVGGPSIALDWITASPYASSGSYTSRVYDGGSQKNWQEASWQAALPAGTAIQLFQRQGNTATPDGTWTAFTAIPASGTNVGGTSRYIQYQADLTTSDASVSPVLEKVNFGCASPTCPTLTFSPVSASVLPDATQGTAYSQTISTNPVGYSFTATGLPAGLTIDAVSGVISGIPTNAVANAAITVTASQGGCTETATYTLSVQAPVPACFSDETAASFNAGTLDASTAANANGITLKPLLTEEFDVLPPTTQWQSFPWATGGGSTLVNGQVVVDGARYNTEPVGTTYGPGTSIDFVGTFGTAPFQHIGLGAGNNVDMYNNTSTWAMFSTGSAGTGLLARVANGGPSVDVPIAGNLLGTPHRYQINWKAGSIEFYVDGNLVHTQNATLTTPMRVGMSDFAVGGQSVSLDRMLITPYAASGSYTSRVYDGGSQKNWQEASWQAALPAGTAIQLFQRQGNTATPDGTWTAFTAIPASGTNVGGTSRYIQYRADLTTTNTSVTPELQKVNIGCETFTCPAVTFTPVTNTVLPVATEGTAYSQTISSDPSGYSFTATGLPAGLAMDAVSGAISGTPSAALTNASIKVIATQGACSDSAFYTLSVNPANQAPELAAIGNKSVTVGQALLFTATATDNDSSQTLTYSVENAPAAATINASSGEFSWMPGSGDIGAHTFKVKVTDNGIPALSDEEEITVTVNPVQYSLLVTAPVNGSVTVNPNQSSFISGDSVMLTAVPDNGYVFSHWSGDATGSSNPLKVIMNGNKTIAANFVAVPTVYTLNATSSGNGNVTVDPNQTSFESGSNATLTAVPTNGFMFSHWSGDASGSANPLTITMDGDKNITANFTAVPVLYNLSVTSSGNGSVTIDPNQSSFTDGSQVTITAVPASGYVFSNWGGDASGNTNPLSVTMNADKFITANFTVVGSNLEVTGFNLIDATTELPLRQINDGDVINLATVGSKKLNIQALTLQPTVGSVVFNLSGQETKVRSDESVPYSLFGDNQGNYYSWIPTAGTYTLTATPYTLGVGKGTAGISRTITFTLMSQPAVAQYYLNVSTVGAGTVTKDPNQASYTSGSNVTLTATPDPGFVFSHWSGAATGNMNPLSVSMNTNKNITANFKLAPTMYTLTVSTSGSGTVNIDPNQTSFTDGALVTLTAVPASGFAFSHWSGSATGNSNPLTLAMNSSKSITAVFLSLASLQVTGFNLIDATTELPLKQLQNGDVINLATVGSKKLNIQALTLQPTVGSVVFNLSGQETKVRSDESVPYSLFGDNNGNYYSWIPTAGTYTLTATPYSLGVGKGTAGIPLTISFSVVNQAVATRVANTETDPVLGIADQLRNATGPLLVAYPNPFRNELNITLETGQREPATLTLTDALGRTCYQQKVEMTDGKAQITLPKSVSLKAGIYFLRAQQGATQKVIKIIRE